MNSSPTTLIPNRAQTLEVLRLMGTHRPILMLPGNDDGYGTRWVLDGQQVQPWIAKYLMKAGFLADTGATEFGARTLTLTESGNRFRRNGVLWWKSLGFLERLTITILG
ncbi:conserved hypothetical protein [Candidatus Accumulibacter aalborgensis]|uniref:Uncharacterized protein n=1 Tax=Candidatus Accumulibacter aalborgensis TaxID=1860102 RepID=A0A1A8XGH2_9PROT|nr:hypothetical protein [Candidatus Accumulibacter aalborgensis]SBT03806.1 conserved hypothetical protein [Candidatus Accumulibacter aalborgensis]